MNITNIKNCFGCGVCAASCGKRLIEIQQNNDGFYEPVITSPQLCTDCGLCVEVCAFSHDDYALKKHTVNSYGAWSKEYVVRRKCSSGGVAFEVGRYLLEQGYKVLGCRYNVRENKAEHYVATTVEELIPSIGSKYIQSYTVDGFKQINRKEKYLVTGTPCQIDSFRRYIQKLRCEENFVLMDFFCHGVPSKLMWDKYVKWAEKSVGKLTNVSWRDKHTGWHDSWVMILNGKAQKDDKHTIISKKSEGDIFYKLFLGDYCSNPACRRNCRFKYDRSSADIRIGDAWGKIYKKNEEGVNIAVAFTKRGNDILQSCNIVLEEHDFTKIAEGQMKKNAKSAMLSFVAMRMLKSEQLYTQKEWKRLFFIEGLFHIPYRLKCKIKKMLSTDS